MTIRRMASELIVAALLLVALNACGSGGNGGTGGSPSSTASFSLTVESTSVSIPVGAELLLKVHVNRNANFKDPVSVTMMQTSTELQSETLVLPGTIDSGLLSIVVGSGVSTGSVPIQLVAQAGGNSATASTQLTIVPPEPSSKEKIEAAVATGTLDYGTSLLYRAYALWGDRRLPGVYRGLGSIGEDNGLLLEIQKSFADFPTELQAELQSFIVRPADLRSVWNISNGQNRSQIARLAAATEPTSISSCPLQSSTERSWLSKRSGTYPVRVWVQCVGSQLEDIEGERLLDSTLGLLNKIYGPMTALLGEPILDEEGGDNAIDFYLVDPGQYVYRNEETITVPNYGAATNTLPKVGNGVSAFVTIPRFWVYTLSFHTQVIHEFFHVLQFAHNSAFFDRPRPLVSGLREYHWFPEASATWAAAYFDRVLAPWETGRAAYLSSHLRFTVRFQPEQEALNALRPDQHRYAAYIWPYFVEQETGGPAFMQQIWDRLANVTTFEQADDAIDSVYPFTQNFKGFALRNLNTEFLPGDPLPRNKRYVSLDPEQFPDGKEPTYLLREKLIADQEKAQAVELPNLGSRYLRLSSQDANIKKVELDFSGLQPAGFTDVQALVKTVGGWVSQPLDLGSGRVTFCFDQGPTTVSVRGSFDEIVLIVSNHDKRLDNKVTGSLRIRPQSTPCAPVWEGTFTHTLQGPAGTNWTATMAASVVFEPVPGPVNPGFQQFRVRSGNYNFVEKIVGMCTTTRTASGPMLPSLTDPAVPGHVFGGFVVTPRPDLSAGYLGQGLTTVEESWVEVCPDYTHQGKILQGQLWWSMFLPPGETSRPLAPDLSPDGKTIKGFAEKSDIGGGVFRSEWQLQLKEE